MRLPRRLRTGEEATLVEHLDELRGRILVCLAALAVGCVVGYVFHHELLHWLNAPLPHRLKPTTFGVAEPFLISIKLSLWAGFALALPVILWQTWSFLSPAVDEHAQRVVVAAVVIATALLVCGVLFGYFLALPAAIHYLTNYDKDEFRTALAAKQFYSFELMVLAAVGLVFELPIVVVALTTIGILSTRQLRKNRRIGYFVVCCVAVALPGIDPVTTAIEAIPLVVLYEASIWVSVLMERRRERAQVPGTAPG
jgi:sec-independent protein translocase protein TatC